MSEIAAVQPAYDIAVVGGGPVGAAAALALARDGFDVALVERQTEPEAFDGSHYSPRVYALSHASRQVLQKLGVWPAIAAARISPYSDMRVWVDDPAKGLAFGAAQLGVGELGWIIEHPLLLRCLWDALPAAGVAIFADAGDVSWQANGVGGAQLRLECGSSLGARLVVAADGAQSALRQAAGIDTIGWSYPQRALVCTLQTREAHQATAWQRFLPSGPLAFLPLADGGCSLVWSVDEARADELLNLNDDDFCAALGAAAQVLGGVCSVTPRLSFQLSLLHATDYVRPCMALVGDAAHTMHPLAGQGANLGLADVASLSDTLDQARAVGRDWAGMRTLKRYARARRADTVEMLALTDTLQKAFNAGTSASRQVLGNGMRLVNTAAPLKNWLARQALA